MSTRLRIKSDGTLVGIYNDALVPLLGALRKRGLAVKISRASNVEPDNESLYGGNWLVDLYPLGGGIHYTDEAGEPFLTREAALAYEIRRVEEYHGFIREEKKC